VGGGAVRTSRHQRNRDGFNLEPYFFMPLGNDVCVKYFIIQRYSIFMYDYGCLTLKSNLQV